MTTLLEQLDSRNVAQYAVALPCFICGEGNSAETELCKHCHAPMALAHHARMHKVRPHMVGVVGPSASGKTAFLGMLLDLLSRQEGELQLVARGAYSISLQQAVVGHLERCQFPEGTPLEPDHWHWVHAQTCPRGRRGLELMLPDMSGDALLEEINHPNSYPVVRRFLEMCSGLLVLVDAAQLDFGESEPDFFAMKLLSFMATLQRQGTGRKLQLPVAVVFTKSDQCESAFDDPARFAERRTPGLRQVCERSLSRVQYFAASVVGACGYTYTRGGKQMIPLRIEPRGVVEPFQWLVSNLKR
jgi:energy-coupling factor transporter ATP-binding protein EcfA2